MLTYQKPIIIWGASGHAVVVADIISLQNQYKIIGFIDNINSELHKTRFLDSLILGGEEQLEKFQYLREKFAVIAIGNCKVRLQLSTLVLKHNFELATLVHPKATVATDVSIGSGTVVCAGAIVNPRVTIGRNVIINTGAIIEHDSIIDDGVHICPGVRLAGNVHIHQGSWVGIGSVVIEKVSIGEWSLIGAGSLVLHDISDRVVVYGHPAQEIRDRNVSDIYMLDLTS
ncbi:acetyltransferase [Arthrospira platensis SPKY2]